MSSKVGTVFYFNQIPDVFHYPFVIKKFEKTPYVKKGVFVCVNTVEGRLIGEVEKIILLNEYFSDPLTIKSYNLNKNPNILKGLFPSEDFEFAIAIVKCLGILKESEGATSNNIQITRMTYPANPGSDVYLVENTVLSKFLGFNNENGLCLGNVKSIGLKANIDLNRLLNKHFSILSISGGGKSYLSSIIIEELMSRKLDQGTPAIILIDVHGEYAYLNDIEDFEGRNQFYDGSYCQISVPNLNAWAFKKYQDNMSIVQVRELSKYIQNLKSLKEKKYSINDLIQTIEEDEVANKSTRLALISWLTELQKLTIFGSEENPILSDVVKERVLSVFSLDKITNIRKKQIILDYLCSRLFYLRRMNKIPPFLLILEESHQFCPEAAHSKAISKSIIETIAREGRKFMACLCLISQRPKKLSTTALSQCNSKLILNIKNPYDLKHLMDSSEAITKESVEVVSRLSVGEMLLMGNAVNYPVFIEVRKKKYEHSKQEEKLTDVCFKWQDKIHLS